MQITRAGEVHFIKDAEQITKKVLDGKASLTKQICSEHEFLNIFKHNWAEIVSVGFQFNCYDIFNNDKTLDYRHSGHFSDL
jgi:hypothetical protein